MADLKAIKVFISSPSDCEEERKAVKEVLNEMNKTSAKSKGITFQYICWEELTPGLGSNPQNVIEEQLGDYNVIIGIMWYRFGTPIPGGANSGTEHEVEHAIKSWEKIGEPRVMFYFKESSPKNIYTIDPDQFSKVIAFRNKLQKIGLICNFFDVFDFEKKLRIHLHNFIDILQQIKPRMNEGKKILISKTPYPFFSSNFRDIIDPIYYDEQQALLHLVFGNISNIHKAVAVIGVNQDFDFGQSSSKSVLGSFNSIKIKNKLFLTALNELWLEKERPHSAGLGTSKYLTLPQNDNELPGVILTVTTRNFSSNPLDRGLYVNTPIEGIKHVMDKVIEEANINKINFLAIPLLGAGFANILRTFNRKDLQFVIEKVILCITIQKVEEALKNHSNSLKRVVIVIYSNEASSKRENQIWGFATKVIGSNDDKRKNIIDSLLLEIDNHETK